MFFIVPTNRLHFAALTEATPATWKSDLNLTGVLMQVRAGNIGITHAAKRECNRLGGCWATWTQPAAPERECARYYTSLDGVPSPTLPRSKRNRWHEIGGAEAVSGTTRRDMRDTFQQAKRQVKHERRGPLSWKGRVLAAVTEAAE